MKDLVWKSFLKQQYAEARELARRSDLLEVLPLFGDPPHQYIAKLRCKGLARERSGELVEFDRWAIGIRFSEDYLRRPVVVQQVLTYLGMAPEPWHPNIAGPFVCLQLTTGMPLVQILFGLWDLLSWNSYSTADEGLNHAASQWARQQPPHRFPIDRRPLKRLSSQSDNLTNQVGPAHE